jgi:L-lactate dehydrogenase complex protein LldG
MVGAGGPKAVSGSRERVLSGIRQALAGRSGSGEGKVKSEARLAHPAPNIVPARGRLDRGPQVELFVAEAERVNATTERLERWEDAPAAIARYLKSANLPTALRVATDPSLSRIDWSREPLLSVATGAAEASDKVSVTGAFGGVAETGTVVMLSGPEHPTTLNFLPDIHVAVFAADRIVGTYEEIWARLRETLGPGRMPRVINWITGPSRTADIEQTLLLGAHGPLRLHILIVDD